MTDTPRDVIKDGIFALDDAARRELALALLQRSNAPAAGEAAFRQRYPLAPEEMIHTAAFHVYVDGSRAVVDFLAEAELAIREPRHEIHQGVVWELLYHVYNWFQFRELLPHGQQDVLDLVAQLRQAVEENDMEFVKATLEDLEATLGGSQNAPDISKL